MKHMIRRQKPVTRRRRRGQATVEFALIFPVFLLMTVAVVDMARIYSTHIALVDSVRDAALWAAQESDRTVKWCDPTATDPIPCPAGSTVANHWPDPNNIASKIKSAGMEPAQVVMAAPVCVPVACLASTDSKITIGATYQFKLLTPILSEIFGGNISMSVETTAQVINDAP